MDVVAPDGRSWRVRRRWLPRHEGRGLRARWSSRPRRRRRQDDGGTRWYDWIDLPLGLGDGPLWIVGIVVVVLVVLALVFWGIPLLLALLDVVVVLIVLVASVLGRVVFRRPWTVEAVAGDGERRTRQVVGWRAAGRAAEGWADELRHGQGE